MNYKECLVQVDEVLNYLSKEDLNKIPVAIRQQIKNEKDKTYNWKYDKFKSFSEQKLDRNSLAILSYLNMEFLVTKEQKDFLNKMYSFNEKKKKNKWFRG